MSQNVIPYICVREAHQAIDFYKQAFSAKELMRHAGPDGRIRHAEIEISGSKLMFCDQFPEFREMKSLQDLGVSAVNLFVYVDDVDSLASQAVAAGAKIMMPIEDKEYGRSGGLVDPYGLVWWITNKPAA